MLGFLIEQHLLSADRMRRNAASANESRCESGTGFVTEDNLNWIMPFRVIWTCEKIKFSTEFNILNIWNPNTEHTLCLQPNSKDFSSDKVGRHICNQLYNQNGWSKSIHPPIQFVNSCRRIWITYGCWNSRDRRGCETAGRAPRWTT